MDRLRHLVVSGEEEQVLAALAPTPDSAATSLQYRQELFRLILEQRTLSLAAQVLNYGNLENWSFLDSFLARCLEAAQASRALEAGVLTTSAREKHAELILHLCTQALLGQTQTHAETPDILATQARDLLGWLWPQMNPGEIAADESSFHAAQALHIIAQNWSPQCGPTGLPWDWSPLREHPELLAFVVPEVPGGLSKDTNGPLIPQELWKELAEERSGGLHNDTPKGGQYRPVHRAFHKPAMSTLISLLSVTERPHEIEMEWEETAGCFMQPRRVSRHGSALHWYIATCTSHASSADLKQDFRAWQQCPLSSFPPLTEDGRDLIACVPSWVQHSSFWCGGHDEAWTLALLTGLLSLQQAFPVCHDPMKVCQGAGSGWSSLSDRAKDLMARILWASEGWPVTDLEMFESEAWRPVLEGWSQNLRQPFFLFPKASDAYTTLKKGNINLLLSRPEHYLPYPAPFIALKEDEMRSLGDGRAVALLRQGASESPALHHVMQPLKERMSENAALQAVLKASRWSTGLQVYTRWLKRELAGASRASGQLSAKDQKVIAYSEQSLEHPLLPPGLCTLQDAVVSWIRGDQRSMVEALHRLLTATERENHTGVSSACTWIHHAAPWLIDVLPERVLARCLLSTSSPYAHRGVGTLLRAYWSGTMAIPADLGPLVLIHALNSKQPIEPLLERLSPALEALPFDCVEWMHPAGKPLELFEGLLRTRSYSLPGGLDTVSLWIAEASLTSYQQTVQRCLAACTVLEEVWGQPESVTALFSQALLNERWVLARWFVETHGQQVYWEKVPSKALGLLLHSALQTLEKPPHSNPGTDSVFLCKQMLDRLDMYALFAGKEQEAEDPFETTLQEEVLALDTRGGYRAEEQRTLLLRVLIAYAPVGAERGMPPVCMEAIGRALLHCSAARNFLTLCSTLVSSRMMTPSDAHQNMCTQRFAKKKPLTKSWHTTAVQLQSAGLLLWDGGAREIVPHWLASAPEEIVGSIPADPCTRDVLLHAVVIACALGDDARVEWLIEQAQGLDASDLDLEDWRDPIALRYRLAQDAWSSEVGQEMREHKDLHTTCAMAAQKLPELQPALDYLLLLKEAEEWESTGPQCQKEWRTEIVRQCLTAVKDQETSLSLSGRTTRPLPRFLRHLHSVKQLSLHSWQMGADFPEICKGLTALQSLSMTHISHLKHFGAGLTHLAALHSLELHACGQLVKLPEEVGQHNRLRTLKIDSCRNFSQVSSGLFQSASLVSLEVTECNALRLGNARVAMPSLERLCFRNCASLDSIPDGLLESPTLTELEIIECYALSLPVWLGELPSLTTLRISCCPALGRGPEGYVGLTRLRTLGIYGSYSVTLPRGLDELPLLEHLTIQDSPLLSIHTETLARCTALRTLAFDCPALANLPEGLLELEQLQTIQLCAYTSLEEPSSAVEAAINSGRLHIEGWVRLQALRQYRRRVPAHAHLIAPSLEEVAEASAAGLPTIIIGRTDLRCQPLQVLHNLEEELSHHGHALRISFHGESGMDCGGLKRELWTELGHRLFSRSLEQTTHIPGECVPEVNRPIGDGWMPLVRQCSPEKTEADHRAAYSLGRVLANGIGSWAGLLFPDVLHDGFWRMIQALLRNDAPLQVLCESLDSGDLRRRLLLPEQAFFDNNSGPYNLSAAESVADFYFDSYTPPSTQEGKEELLELFRKTFVEEPRMQARLAFAQSFLRGLSSGMPREQDELIARLRGNAQGSPQTQARLTFTERFLHYLRGGMQIPTPAELTAEEIRMQFVGAFSRQQTADACTCRRNREHLTWLRDWILDPSTPEKDVQLLVRRITGKERLLPGEQMTLVMEAPNSSLGFRFATCSWEMFVPALPDRATFLEFLDAELRIEDGNSFTMR